MLDHVRRICVSLLLGCLLAVAGAVVASPASACSCVGGTTAEFFERADAVFTGSLVSREVERTGAIGSSADPALHVFAVDTVYKGTVHEDQGVVSPESSAGCGLTLSGEGRVVVFATRSADGGAGAFPSPAGGHYAAFLCGGTGPADAAVEAELAALRGPSGEPPAPGTAGDQPAESGSTLLVPELVAAGGLAVVLVGGLAWRRRRSAP
jgi:hypothetical protein